MYSLTFYDVFIDMCQVDMLHVYSVWVLIYKSWHLQVHLLRSFSYIGQQLDTIKFIMNL
jgi:hypothetical protein